MAVLAAVGDMDLSLSLWECFIKAFVQADEDDVVPWEDLGVTGDGAGAGGGNDG